MFALFGLSVTMRGPFIKSTSNIVSLVSSVAIPVNEINGVGGRSDLNQNSEGCMFVAFRFSPRVKGDFNYFTFLKTSFKKKNLNVQTYI